MKIIEAVNIIFCNKNKILKYQFYLLSLSLLIWSLVSAYFISTSSRSRFFTTSSPPDDEELEELRRPGERS